uniref:Uncharacterized protein n=1 Tax=Strongyloides venezuelensis TaxID=75913 RepID=A0A0K0F253_STRVS
MNFFSNWFLSCYPVIIIFVFKTITKIQNISYHPNQFGFIFQITLVQIFVILNLNKKNVYFYAYLNYNFLLVITSRDR